MRLEVPKSSEPWYLEDSVGESGAVERGDGGDGLLVLAHRDEPVALALARLEVPDDLHLQHCSEGTEELPERRVFRLRRQVVDEDAESTGTRGGRSGRRGHRYPRCMLQHTHDPKWCPHSSTML